MKTNPPFIYSYKFSTIARTNEKTLHPSLSEVNNFVSYILGGGKGGLPEKRYGTIYFWDEILRFKTSFMGPCR